MATTIECEDESDANPAQDIKFPDLLAPADDRSPTTVITHTSPQGPGKLLLRGTTFDNGTVTKVSVNGRSAKATAPNFAESELVLHGVKPGETNLTAGSEDAADHVEKLPHIWGPEF